MKLFVEIEVTEDKVLPILRLSPNERGDLLSQVSSLSYEQMLLDLWFKSPQSLLNVPRIRVMLNVPTSTALETIQNLEVKNWVKQIRDGNKIMYGLLRTS